MLTVVKVLHNYKPGDQRPARAVRRFKEIAVAAGGLSAALGRHRMVLEAAGGEVAVFVSWFSGQEVRVLVCIGRPSIRRARVWDMAAHVLPYAAGYFRNRPDTEAARAALVDCVEFGKDRWEDAVSAEEFVRAWGATRPRLGARTSPLPPAEVP